MEAQRARESAAQSGDVRSASGSGLGSKYFSLTERR